MQTILIPTDFSHNSWNALAYAVKLFKDVPCNFYILHVGALSQSSVKGNSFSLPMSKITPSIKEKLEDVFQRIKQLPINKEHHFVALQDYGNLVSILRKTVEEKKIDLIVMGTKGASGIQESVIGSNTGDVITKVACNLLVVPENAKFNSPKEIAFPTDYNIFYSHAILETISKVLHMCKANLQVIHVSNIKKELNATQKTNKTYLQDYLEELFAKSHSFHTLKDKNVKTAIDTFTKTGNIDMVIMVAKNLNFLQQLLFDSTIEKLSFHTTLPLLVLHE
ncbi:universal stress protein [Zobellia laminariae]|uniref:universal stress protein n=1 Tax=Zobellia laminariae TaxID=248906 RepID=UPI0026F41AB0|nr:universal stress protein [Zobellia laminariae]WKX76896.1 universal stress protein [Zobellia laminariae]